MKRRPFVAHARVLPVHLAIDIDGCETRFIEPDKHLAVLDGTRGRFAFRMHRCGLNRPAVDAGDFDLHGTGGFKIHVSVRPAR